MRIRETLEEDSQGFARLWERIHEDFGMRTSQGFMRLWKRIRKTFGEDSQGFCKTLGEDSRGFLQDFWR